MDDPIRVLRKRHYAREVSQTRFNDRRFTFEDIFGSDFVIMTPTVIQSLSCTSDDFVFMCNRDNLITFRVAIRALILMSGISGFLEISQIKPLSWSPEKTSSPFDFISKNFRGHVLFVGPLIPLFWTSGAVCPGFQSQGGYRLHTFFPACYSSDSHLVWHLPTSWWPEW